MEEGGEPVVFHKLLAEHAVVGELLGEDVLAADLRGRRRGAGRAEQVEWRRQRSEIRRRGREMASAGEGGHRGGSRGVGEGAEAAAAPSSMP